MRDRTIVVAFLGTLVALGLGAVGASSNQDIVAVAAVAVLFLVGIFVALERTASIKSHDAEDDLPEGVTTVC